MALQACVVNHSLFSSSIRYLAGVIALGMLLVLSACQSTDTNTKPIDPMEVHLTGMENAALKSHSSYLASVARQQQEEAAVEAAMPKPDLTKGPEVIPLTGGTNP